MSQSRRRFSLVPWAVAAVLLSQNASAVSVLTPEIVFEKFSGTTKQVENTLLEGQAGQRRVSELQGAFDPVLGFQIGTEINRNEDLAGLSNLEDRNLRSGLGITKKFRSGTELEAQYTFTQQRSLLNTFTSSLRDPNVVENKFTLSLRQPLVYNTLGNADRLLLESARLQDDATQMLAEEQSEELLLSGLETYWRAYQAKRSLELGIEARDIYAKLLRSTRERRRLGQADAGDLARVQIASDAQERRVKEASSMFLNALDELYHFLEVERPEGEVSFKVPAELPALPTDSAAELAETRQWKSLSSQAEALDAEKSSYKLQNLPVLDLVGEASWNGVDTEASTSLSEAIGGERPKYFIGIEFAFRFGNQGTKSRIADTDRMIRIQQNQLELTRNLMDLQGKSLIRNLQSLFQMTTNARKSIEQYRVLLRAQNRNYRQGRIDMSQLIEDYTRMFDAELSAVQFFSNYHITLHRWAAHNDRLIKQ